MSGSEGRPDTTGEAVWAVTVLALSGNGKVAGLMLGTHERDLRPAPEAIRWTGFFLNFTLRDVERVASHRGRQ